jgi:transcriptional regulator with XRE-family HTH domain
LTDVETFGAALKDWRTRRRLSQLDLALDAEVSARHISFLETGRAEPSRDMVLHLSEALELPLRARNQMLISAGFAAAFPETALDAAALAPVRRALEYMMAQHSPYPALICDRHWNLVNANPAAARLLGLAPGAAGGNLARMVATNPAFEQAIVNWPEVVREFRSRLRLEARACGGDPVILELAGVLDAIAAGPAAAPSSKDQPFMTIKLRHGDDVLSLFSTLAVLGTARDITLNDLRIELFFPADETSAQMLRSMGA